MSDIRACDRAAGCQDEVYALCEEPGCGQGDQLSRGVQDGCPEEGTWHGVTVFHNLQGPFTTTASFAPHCSPVAELGPGLSLPFCALDSREHILLEWALSVGHGPKAWEGGAKTPTVGEGRAGWSPRPVLPWIPHTCFLGRFTQDQASWCPNVFLLKTWKSDVPQILQRASLINP